MFRPGLWPMALFLVVLAVFSGGCGQTASQDIEDIKWVLASYGDPDKLTAVIAGTQITATFDSEQDRVGGTSGCNSYSGDYEIEGNHLSIAQIAATEMACLNPQGIMEQEQRYLEILIDADNYEVNGDILRIDCAGKVLIYTAEQG